MNEPMPEQPAAAPPLPPPPGDPVHRAGGDAGLLEGDAREELRSRWGAVQGGFVDEPRRAVERADSLVADAMQRIARSFADQRVRLEDAWARDGEISTEDLRRTLQRYRAFFDRLLSV